jgi:hypothetical protein
MTNKLQLLVARITPMDETMLAEPGRSTILMMNMTNSAILTKASVLANSGTTRTLAMPRSLKHEQSLKKINEEREFFR